MIPLIITFLSFKYSFLIGKVSAISIIIPFPLSQGLTCFLRSSSSDFSLACVSCCAITSSSERGEVNVEDEESTAEERERERESKREGETEIRNRHREM